MLKIIQIIAILQGLFLGFALFQRREKYKTPIFGLFLGCIVSVVLFSIGDDNYNLIVNNSKWFFFHEPLIITYTFLFVKYSNTERDTFKKNDFLFFAPYFLYLLVETLTNSILEDNSTLKTVGKLIESSFLIMLLYSIYDIITHRKNKWFLAFIIPFTIILIADSISSFFSNSDESILLLDSYGIFLIAIFLFYFVTYKLIIAPKDILPTSDNKYKSSKLSKEKAESIKKELDRLMTEERLFKNQKLSVNEVAEKLGITRQQLSEILNNHLGLRFQDLLNQYRVEEFINCLHQENYKNYTMFGIATEAGFNSKSSFNATFKKLKGLTPSQYKKQYIA